MCGNCLLDGMLLFFPCFTTLFPLFDSCQQAFSSSNFYRSSKEALPGGVEFGVRKQPHIVSNIVNGLKDGAEQFDRQKACFSTLTLANITYANVYPAVIHLLELPVT